MLKKSLLQLLMIIIQILGSDYSIYCYILDKNVASFRNDSVHSLRMQGRS